MFRLDALVLIISCLQQLRNLYNNVRNFMLTQQWHAPVHPTLWKLIDQSLAYQEWIIASMVFELVFLTTVDLRFHQSLEEGHSKTGQSS